MSDDIRKNATSAEHWLRLVFMLLFAVIIQVAAAVMWVVVIVQFLFALFTGSDNTNLRSFGHSLSVFIYRTWQFLSYNSEDKPFPFQDWPDSDTEVSE
ncbi:MAG: DUF4389 domain-containing protein [Cellvibrionaceae bacterium]